MNISRYSWGILEKILGIVPGKFPGIDSEDLFATNFLWVFWRIGNKKFPRICYKNFLGKSYKNFLGMGYKKFLGPGSSELVTRNFREKLSTFSPDFPVKDSWEFPWIPRKDSWEFPRIFRKIVTWVVCFQHLLKNICKDDYFHETRSFDCLFLNSGS